MSTEKSVTLWSRGTLTVTATRKPDGALLIYGQDFGHPLCEEYEYWITVRPADVPRLVSALGGADGDDPLDVVRDNGEALVTAGEQTWIEEQGITADFFNRMGDPRSSE